MKARLSRTLDFTKVDNKRFEALMEQHITGVQQAFADLTVALGELHGHGAMAKVLSERISDVGIYRNTTGQSLLSAAWLAASQRAGQD